jgi:hypothetical protein
LQGQKKEKIADSVKEKSYASKTVTCHAQSLAATNRVTEQLSWLAVESFFMSCSISWMASLIDNLYHLDLVVLVIN